MGVEGLSNLTLLNGHKQRTDSASISYVAQEFVSRNENRKSGDTSALRSALKRSKGTKVCLTDIMAVLDSITSLCYIC